VSKTYARVGIGLGFVFLFAGALDVRGHFGIWAASSILLGLFLILFGGSLFVGAKRQKSTRRVSFGFLGAALILLCIALALFRS
jgi:peptidoglycan biosynthesis protein MviN/MurJ (putative lipid II flippase)